MRVLEVKSLLLTVVLALLNPASLRRAALGSRPHYGSNRTHDLTFAVSHPPVSHDSRTTEAVQEQRAHIVSTWEFRSSADDLLSLKQMRRTSLFLDVREVS